MLSLIQKKSMKIILYPPINNQVCNYYIVGLKEYAKKNHIEIHINWNQKKSDLFKKVGDKLLLITGMVIEINDGQTTYISYLRITDDFDEIFFEILPFCSAYFHNNYNEKYIQDNIVKSEISKIYPLGLHFVIPYFSVRKIIFLINVFLGFKTIKNNKLSNYQKKRLLVKEFESLFLRPNISFYRKCRKAEKDFDVAWKAYGNSSFGYAIEPENRKKLRMEISNISGLNMQSHERRSFNFNLFKEIKDMRPYLRWLAGSKVTFALNSGLKSAISWRIGEQLAAGMFVLVEKPIHSLYMMPEEGKEACYFLLDETNLNAKILKYVNDDDLRLKISNNGTKLFDEIHAPEMQAKYIIECIMKKNS